MLLNYLVGIGFWSLLLSESVGANLTLRIQAPSAVSGRSFWLSCDFLSQPHGPLFLKVGGDPLGAIYYNGSYPCKPAKNPSLSNLPVFGRSNVTCNDTASTVTINPVHLSEDGTNWTCSAGQSTNSNPYIMDVQVPVSAVAITISSIVSSHGRISLIEGQPSKLQCTANGSKPVAQITWFKLKPDGHKEQLSGVQTNITTPNNLSDAISTLTLRPQRSDDGAIVYCRASNVAGEPAVFSRNISLDVSYAPLGVPLISGYNTSTPVYENDTVTVTCSWQGGKPGGQVQLSCPGNAKRSGLSAVSVNVKVSRRMDGQRCRCTGTHVARNSSDNSTESLNVYYPPSTVTTRQDRPWLEGRQGSLTCQSTPGKPVKTEYKWLNGSSSGAVVAGIQILNFSRLEAYNNGQKYGCEASNQYNNVTGGSAKSKFIILNVYYYPRIKIKGSTTVREGSQLNLNCSVTGNPPPAKFNWSYQGKSEPLQVLVINNVTRNNTANYTCTATADTQRFGPLTRRETAEVTIQFPPDVQVKSAGIIAGQESRIECTPYGTPEKYVFHNWQQKWQNQIIQEMGNNSALILKSPSHEDMGLWVCRVDNGLKGPDGQVVVKTGSLTIMVEGPPVFGKNENIVRAEAGQNKSLTLEFFSYPSFTNLTWSLEGRYYNTISSTGSSVTLYLHGHEIESDGNKSTLHLENLSASDFNKSFTLNVTNAWGSAVETVSLRAAGPPLKPERFRIVNVTVSSITLSWMSGFDGGYHQSFILSYIGGSQRNWNPSNISLPSKGREIVHEVTGLEANTNYTFKLYAQNERPLGDRVSDEVLVSGSTQTGGGGKAALIVGGVIGGALALFGIVVVVFLLVRRSRMTSKGKDTGSQNNLFRAGSDNGHAAAESVPPEYAQVQKASRPVQENNTPGAECEYAQVSKSRKTAIPADTELEKGAVYSEVKKNEHPGAQNGGQPVSGLKKPKPQPKPVKNKKAKDCSDVYENAAKLKGAADRQEIYENVTIPGGGAAAKNNSAPMELVYADLDLNSKDPKRAPRKTDRSNVDGTEYASIDFNVLKEQSV